MKRYALFGGSVYYPSGGWYDFRGTFDSIEEAAGEGKSKFSDTGFEWWHVADLTSGTVVLKRDAS